VAGDDRTGKAALRQDLLDARSRLTAGELSRAAEQIAGHGDAAWSGLARVAAYRSFGSEPPTDLLLQRLFAAGVTVLVPVVRGDDLDWAAVNADTRWRTSSLGAAEPAGPWLGRSAVTTVDVVVVPALAVDRHGNRLGRGRGYYDRALVSVTAPVVAVVYDEEVLASVPAEPHDRRVDAVLTPSGLATLPRTR